MILLLGGTSETALLADALNDAGHKVLVSTATEVPLFIGKGARISRRTGPLDRDGMATLIRERNIWAVVDATHPYASQVRATAREVAAGMKIPYLTFIRPKTVGEGENVRIASVHEEAARIACSQGRPVLLTIGSKNLESYVQEASRTGVRIVVRVLSHPESLEACRRVGIGKDRIIAGRGPFSVEENRALIRKFEIGVLVTKDSGLAGGVGAKLEAARKEGCQVVVVRRPEQSSDSAFEKMEDLVHAVSAALGKEPGGACRG